MCKLVLSTTTTWLSLLVPCVGTPAHAIQQAAVGKPAASQFDKQRIAIITVFCEGKVDLENPCSNGADALVVAKHESSEPAWSDGRCYDARNGQYHGCFQMGTSERATYGDGTGFWNQAKAAYKYFVDSGKDWSPWSCKPSGYCY